MNFSMILYGSRKFQYISGKTVKPNPYWWLGAGSESDKFISGRKRHRCTLKTPSHPEGSAKVSVSQNYKTHHGRCLPTYIYIGTFRLV